MSRLLSDLTPEAQLGARCLLDMAALAGLDLLIYCTYRSDEEQARLYRQGRPLAQIEAMARELETRWQRPDLATVLLDVGPQHGRKVTNAAPGQSAHGYRIAFDAVPMVDGKPLWRDRGPGGIILGPWALYGKLTERAGFDWSGRWLRFRELPHSQLPGFDWRERIKAT